MNRTMILSCVVACSGGSTNAPDTSDLFPAACPATVCQVGATVTTAAELAIAVNAAAGWQGFADYTTGCLPTSSELAVTGAVTLAGTAIALPAGCAPNRCEQQVRFRIDPAATGVTCNEPEHYYEFTVCGSITLTDTKVRTRAVVLDLNIVGSIPIVEVLGACAAACGDDRFACDADHTCWNSVRDHCAYCLNGSNEECACWDGERLLPDGAKCDMRVGGDVVVNGTCQGGVCETRP